MNTPHYKIQKIGEDLVAVRQDCTETNAGWLIGGSLVGLAGLKNRGLLGTLLTLGGAALLYRGITGKNPLCEIQSLLSGSPKAPEHTGGPSHQHDLAAKTHQEPDDALEEASMESFPASDPPARTAHAPS